MNEPQEENWCFLCLKGGYILLFPVDTKTLEKL